jgi:hypothetical protein
MNPPFSFASGFYREPPPRVLPERQPSFQGGSNEHIDRTAWKPLRFHIGSFPDNLPPGAAASRWPLMKISAFAWNLGLSVIVLSLAGLRAQSETGLTVMTVRGPVPAAALGSMLAHEHIMSTFGAEPATRASYDDAAVLAAVVPPLHALREQGVGTIIDATAAFFGREARLLRTISEQSGIHLVTNTGYHGAANRRYLPTGLATMSAPDVAAR